MTDVLATFEDRDDRAERALARQPQDTPPEVLLLNALDFREVRGQHTDKMLANMLYLKWRHLFTYAEGLLYFYDGKLWRSDRMEKRIHLVAIGMSSGFYEELARTQTEREEAMAAGRMEEAGHLGERLSGITKMIVYTEKAGTIGAVARILTTMLETIRTGDEETAMDYNPDILNCRNGVVDLRTGKLHWPRPEDKLTKVTDTDYVPGADMTWWKDRVLQIAGGDEHLARFFQVWFGYCATGHTREHCMAILHGRGRNGKNVLIDTVAAALGEYAKPLSIGFMEQVGGNGGADNNTLYMMATIKGARMVYASETGERGKLREAMVKALTGDQRVTGRQPYGDFTNYKPAFKFIVGTNHKPGISGTDDGVWERIRLVPMAVKFGDQDEVDAGVAQYLKDVTLMEEVKLDARREQVLAWVVEGARMYLEHGLRRYTPHVVTLGTRSYRREQDVLGGFLQEVAAYVPPEEVAAVQHRVEVTKSRALAAFSNEDLLRVSAAELWRVYAVWAADNGHRVMSSNAFGRLITGAPRFWPEEGGGELMMRPLVSIRTNRGQCYEYFRWSDPGKQMLAHVRAQAPSNYSQAGPGLED